MSALSVTPLRIINIGSSPHHECEVRHTASYLSDSRGGAKKIVTSVSSRNQTALLSTSRNDHDVDLAARCWLPRRKSILHLDFVPQDFRETDSRSKPAMLHRRGLTNKQLEEGIMES